MPVDAIGQVSANAAAISSQSNIGLEDFLQIFLTQLSFQDPLEPVDNREFLAQLAQFSSLEVSNRTNEEVSSLVEVTAVNQSLSLLGKTVEVTRTGSRAVGEVTTLRYVGGTPRLTILTSSGQVVTDLKPSEVTLVR